MSVENFDKLGGALDMFGAIPDLCFRCRKPLSGITVLWYGGGGEGIALHPECALNLGAHLCRDGINARLISEGNNPITVGISRGLTTDTS